MALASLLRSWCRDPQRHLKMAFNFSWLPLTADADFYRRARHLLTQALNKSPKPPIIVDDILVSELNLGTVPPDLEILEIGDLAEDRFRGIFRMGYSGDAFLTLKTRVQANPLNTYLYSKPAFTSPQPLAAASGLTIPLSITLSDIKLSAFIILVFSKQKGLTLVFRNDPLESLKVSSTFDSIQFVRDYLQRTIEQQLRNLMMDELPAIIHRLSLQLWCPEQANKGMHMPPRDMDDAPRIDPFASLPLDPVDSYGNLLNDRTLSELTLDGSDEMQSLFSQRSLLRLAALTDCHRTLSLFTPGIRDVMVRAWSGHGDRSESPNAPYPASAGLSKTNSFPTSASTSYSFDSGNLTLDQLACRASVISLGSAPPGPISRARPGRKKKTRVLNLRRSHLEARPADEMYDKISDTDAVTVLSAEPVPVSSTTEQTDRHTKETVNCTIGSTSVGQKPRLMRQPLTAELFQQDRQESCLRSQKQRNVCEFPTPFFDSSFDNHTPGSSNISQPQYHAPCGNSDTSSEIMEQAWIMKMADEIARHVYDEKKRQHPIVWDESERSPPPAYHATAI